MVWCMVGLAMVLQVIHGLVGLAMVGLGLAMVLQVIHGLVYGGVGYGPPGNSWSGVWWGWLWSSG